MSGHTPTPWRLMDTIQHGHDTKQGGKYAFREISSKNSIMWIARVQAFNESPVPSLHDGAHEAEANAAFIVRAVNAHDALVEALTELYSETADYIARNNLGDVHHNQAMKLARSALALARGEQVQS